jgi:hypothetical protein
VPKTYAQASTQDCWQQAMKEEIQALQDNHIWDIVSCPTGIKPIGCKWVYTIKFQPDGYTLFVTNGYTLLNWLYN